MASLLSRWTLLPLVMVLTVALSPARAASDDEAHGKFSGEYTFYSLDLGDTGPPTKKDTKLNIWMSGAFAAQLYRRLGSESRGQSCSGDSEVREKGNLVCSRVRATGEVNCGLGFDLRSGKSVLGMIC
jgi:hypothetical protein